MGVLFAKENELSKGEMEMGREMKRRKNVEARGEMTGKRKKEEVRRRQVGRRERKREERMSGRNEMCKERLGRCFGSMKPCTAGSQGRGVAGGEDGENR